MTIRYILLSALLCITSATQANQCEQAKYTEFHFWLGHWQVSNKQNNTISSSHISLINNGCTLLEEYSTPSGYQGKSLNIYDKTRQIWHQTWTDSSGVLLQLEGQFNGQSMVLVGRTINALNQVIDNKITWTPKTNGTIRQHWQTSSDQGKNWQTIFDGLYTKLSKP